MRIDEDTLKLNMIHSADAKTTMVTANLRLAMSIAKRYKRRVLALSDLVQEGSFGLMKAAERFDPNKGFKFSTYATCIKRATRELFLEVGRLPTYEELSFRLQVLTQKIKFCRKAARPVLSMEHLLNNARKGPAASLGSTPGTMLEDSLRDSESEDRLQQSMLKESIMQLLGTLRPREQELVRLRFGLDDGRARTLADIGRVFGVKRERARQIEDRALQKLRQLYRNYELRACPCEGDSEAL
ncbi:RNA polymerase [Tribonema minus]|uniref:RNA polymerase n=1 Tax=Tribonema minus TaxID=303371 RepID=A0A835ZC07_9STRA|nr:RNA polymerase [Tribonema minus]